MNPVMCGVPILAPNLHLMHVLTYFLLADMTLRLIWLGSMWELLSVQQRGVADLSEGSMPLRFIPGCTDLLL